MNKFKAVGLLSGGLDSTLAAKILIDQGIEVYAINFVSPFCTCTPKSMGCSAVSRAVEQLGGIPLKKVALGDDYLQMVKSPHHGYGRGINPCIDCRIMKIRKAAEYMKEIGASYIFTGEVLGQRPMSQHRKAINIIDKESGVAGLILRPLSAAHFEPTQPELQGIIDRSKLLDFQGRSRKPQIELAKEKNIIDYPCPNGGCLLTDELFAVRLKYYFSQNENVSVNDMLLLKTGRHQFTPDGKMIIIARDEKECDTLKRIAPRKMFTFVPNNFSGPVIVSEVSYSEYIRYLYYQYGKPIDANNNMIDCLTNDTMTSYTV
jgi:tRNA U34 2-thiouridine synthase MnmA/TrmU